MPQIRTVGAFVEALKGFESAPITSGRVKELCLDTDLDRSSLSPYVHWRDSFYTRNLIYRDDWFEVMAVCWQKDQITPIHTHNGQLGWMMVVDGCAEVTNYAWKGCNAPEGRQVSGLDCIAGATEIHLERKHVESCHRTGEINVIDKKKTIHRVAAVGGERVVSLHVYSRPIDSCVAFDLDAPRCYRRQLKYYSVHGEVVMSPAEIAALGAPAPASTPVRA